MRIKHLELINFRCFEEYKLSPADRFTLLIGDNGSGKTAILDALAIAVDIFLFEIPDIKSGDKRYLSVDDIRKSSRIMMGQTPIEEIEGMTTVRVNSVIANTYVEWSNRSIHKSNTQYDLYDGALTELVAGLLKEKLNPKTLFPVIAHYGTSRLWKTIPHDVETLSPGSRLLGYENCLNTALGLERLFRWFKTQELAALQKQERRHVLEAVREAIVDMIPDAKKAFWDMDLDELVVEIIIREELHAMPFHLLSDGYRNMIGMVADIAYRMATLNPQLEKDVIKKTEGIVLIDEIDLHLHPKWQGIVVERLLNTFPKVQFVASTHSPFIIQSLYHKKDCLLWDLEKNQPLEIESQSIEDIAEELQGVENPQQSKRYLAMMAAAEAYYEKLHQYKDAPDAELIKLKADLDELSMPFSDDPAFVAQLKFERDTVLAAKGKA